MENRDELLKILKNSGLRAYSGSDKELIVDRIPTGIEPLDVILGGGMPRGRIFMLVGDYSTGKTYLAQKAIQAVQQKNELAVYFNCELKYDPEWWMKTGVNINELIVVEGNVGEHIWEGMLEMISRNVGIVVLDSIAALVPIAEDEKAMEQLFVGDQGKMISKGLRKIIPRMSDKKTIVVFINQLRDTIGGLTPLEVYPGGRAQKFYASIVMRVRRGEWITEKFGDKLTRTGHRIKVRTEKNNLAPPWQDVNIPFYFTGELDSIAGLVSLGYDLGIITHDRQIWKFGDKKFVGVEKMREHFKENEKDFKELRSKILK